MSNSADKALNERNRVLRDQLEASQCLKDLIGKGEDLPQVALQKSSHWRVQNLDEMLYDQNSCLEEDPSLKVYR